MRTRAALTAGLVATTALVGLAQINRPEPPAPQPVPTTILRPAPQVDRLTPRQPL